MNLDMILVGFMIATVSYTVGYAVAWRQADRGYRRIREMFRR